MQDKRALETEIDRLLSERDSIDAEINRLQALLVDLPDALLQLDP